MSSKKVGMDELFYDLVFSYAISSLTLILQQASGTGFSMISCAVYFFSFIVLVNSWTYQTVFLNRYESTGFAQSILIYVQAALMLYLASSLQNSPADIFIPFVLAVGGLSLLLFLEYLLAYFQQKSAKDRHLIRYFLLMTGLRSILILTGAVFPLPIGLCLSLGGVVLGWILPAVFKEQMKMHSIDFSHLSERLSLLVILMFGQMILNLAGWFDAEHFGWYSILAFGLSAVLFQCYVLFYRHFQTDWNQPVTGVNAIYLHYPILIGLNLIALAVQTVPETEPVLMRSCALLYLGLLLFFAGLYGCMIYLEKSYRKALKKIWFYLPAVLAFWLVSAWLDMPAAVLSCAAGCALLQYGMLYWHFRKQKQKNQQEKNKNEAEQE